MKKLTILSAFVSFVALLFTSCTTDVEVPYEGDPVVAKYGKMNTEVSVYTEGTLKKSSSKVKTTRWADANANMWYEQIPDLPTAEEKAEVLAAIANGTATEVNWSDVDYTEFILLSYGGSHKQVYATNTIEGNQEGPFDVTKGMEELIIRCKGESWETTVPNYNEGEFHNQPYFAAKILNGFVSCQIKNENSGVYMNKYKFFYYKGEIYLGFDYYIDNTANKNLAPDGDYSDAVLRVVPVGENDKKYDPSSSSDPTPTPAPVVTEPAHVEFDIHQQEHKDWNEIKTSIHLRDTVNARVFLPIPQDYQAVSDDFAIRTGTQYEYAKKTIYYNKGAYELNLEIAHVSTGIEIFINADATKMYDITGTTLLKQGREALASALKEARDLFGDGITFEVHSYVYKTTDQQQIWNWLKTTQCLSTSTVGSGKPTDGSVVTHTFGQVTSAYYTDDKVLFDVNKQ